MKNVIKSLICLGLLFASACAYEGEEPVQDQEYGVIYILGVTNLKPTTQDLFAECATATIPAHPSAVTTNIRKLTSSYTELPLGTTCVYFYGQKGLDYYLVPGVPGVDFTVTKVGI